MYNLKSQRIFGSRRLLGFKFSCTTLQLVVTWISSAVGRDEGEALGELVSTNPASALSLHTCLPLKHVQPWSVMVFQAGDGFLMRQMDGLVLTQASRPGG